MNKSILFAMVLVVAGCTTPPHYSSIDDFPLGQLSSLERKSQQEILSILGKPTGELSNAKGVTWEYAGKVRFVAVFFYPARGRMANVVMSGRTKEEVYRQNAQTIVTLEELQSITNIAATSGDNSSVRSLQDELIGEWIVAKDLVFDSKCEIEPSLRKLSFEANDNVRWYYEIDGKLEEHNGRFTIRISKTVRLPSVIIIEVAKGNLPSSLPRPIAFIMEGVTVDLDSRFDIQTVGKVLKFTHRDGKKYVFTRKPTECCAPLSICAMADSESNKVMIVESKTQSEKELQGQAISIKTKKAVFVPGEPIILTISLKNVSTNDIEIVGPILAGYDIEVLGPTGEKVPLTLYGKMRFENSRLGSRAVNMLKPGTDFSLEVNLSRLFDMTLRGKYIVSAQSVVGRAQGDTRVVLKVTSNKVNLNVADE
jgi:hypothetical protein